MKIITFLFLISVPLLAKTQTLFADSMALFFKQNPKTTSIISIQNDASVIDFNSNSVMPIGTTSDLLVAVEFAKQAAYKLIDTAERVPLKELVKYYFENSKMDAYSNWINYLSNSKKIKENTVSLLDVVHGMLQFGVLENTEFLMDKLGFDNIKSSIQSFNLKGHTAIVAPIGSLAMFQNRVSTSEKKMLKAIDKLNEEEYCKSAYLMHMAIKNDSTFKSKMPKQFLNDNSLIMWSNKLPKANTKSYASLLQTLLKEKMLDAVFYKMLRKVLEWPMQFATVSNMFDRFTMKGSQTINTFTQAQYGKMKDGKEVVLVYSCTNLSAAQLAKLGQWHQQFELEVFKNVEFVKKIKLVQK